MSEINNCPNCQAKITDGLFKSNGIMPKNYIDAINDFAEEKAQAYCKLCGTPLLKAARNNLEQLIEQSKVVVQESIGHIPIVTIQSPIKWDYDVLGIATGQSTTGTGLFSEISSSFTDLFGVQSSAYNKKILAGEELCSGQVRVKAMQMGGHAVVGTDIDYSELGSVKGMIMVCMSGTVIKLNNTEVLGPGKGDIIKKGLDASARLMDYEARLQAANKEPEQPY